jgi:pyruvate dehydrogenase E1 component
MGASGESANIAHSQKSMDLESLKVFRDRFHVPLGDAELEALPFIRPAPGSEEYEFVRQRRGELGGHIPSRRGKIGPADVPPLSDFANLLAGSGGKEMSTTMGFVRFLNALVKDRNIGKQVVPIVADEARTFGMEGLFRQIGIYSPAGQLYRPEDSDSVMWYREDAAGQILEEGITEAGSMASWIAAGTAYANHGVHMMPFYIFYSMFGFQRIGDMAWAAGDSRARGFLLGATSGRTTLNGEGLQHEDGQGQLLASTIPNCRSYDPAFVYELTVILQDGMRRMYRDEEDVFYYISLLNENAVQPAMPEGAQDGIVRGMYLFRASPAAEGIPGEAAPGVGEPRVQLMGSGAIMGEVLAASELLERDFGVKSDVWSLPGINQLHREGIEAERWNRFHPDSPERLPYMTSLLSGREGPAVIATDYLRAWPEQIRRLVPMPLAILGTDGFGRSDTREALRDFFEVNRYHIALAALHSLAVSGRVDARAPARAMELYGIAAERPDPLST